MLIIRPGCKASVYENKRVSHRQGSRILLSPEKIAKVKETEKKLTGNYSMKKEKL